MINYFEDISALIEKRTGLSVTTRFRSDLHVILQQIADGDLPRLRQLLHSAVDSSPIWQSVVQALTIGETYFFRDGDAFHLIRHRILPHLIRQRREVGRRVLNIWCAGCASGEEPYSVAMTLLEIVPDLHQWTVNLVGTDLNAGSLEHARAGIYRDWSFRHCPPEVRGRHFEAVPGGWRIRPLLREMVTFRQMNLLDGSPLPQCDLVLCRNVLIYLTRTHAVSLEDTLHGALNPGGWLLLGPSEALRGQRERWVTHVFPGTIAYQRPLSPQTAPVTYRHQAAAPKPPVPVVPMLNDRYQAAVAAVHADQHQEAERLLAELLADQPDHAPAHILLAFIFANRQALPEAHAHLDAALALNTLLSDAHYLRAALFLEAGQPALAEEALRAALYCRRDHPLATFLMGNLLAQAGDHQRANRAWLAARALVSALPPEAPVSDLSDLSAAAFDTLIQSQIDRFQG
jgi:chemotaxis protein methyltransferase CheR